MNTRQIKFADTLSAILSTRGSKETRKLICDELGISQSVLTQYLQNRSTPRINTLLELAKLLQVDLNYLVFGQMPDKPGNSDLSEVVHDFDNALSSLHSKFDSQRQILGRMTSILLDQVEATAKQVAAEYEIASGIIHDNELIDVEELSEQIILVRLRLEARDLRDTTFKQPRAPGGRFIPVVARNLSMGKRYTYIVPGSSYDEVEKQVQIFLSSLKGFGVSNACLDNCLVGYYDLPIVAGCCLYQLESEASKRNDLLFTRLASNIIDIDGQKWLGCTLPPSTELQINPVMDHTHLEHALRTVRSILRSDNFTPVFGHQPRQPTLALANS